MTLTACSAANYGQSARSVGALPANAEIAARTQYTSYYHPAGPSPFTVAVADRIDVLMMAPMTEQAVLEVALLNDPEVQQMLRDHDRERPQLVGELAALQDDGAAQGRSAEWLLTGILMARTPTSAWRREFAAEFLDVAAMLVDKAAEARARYYEAVAAGQMAAMFDQVLQSEQASAVLANEQYRSGTLSRLDQAQRQLAHAETFKAALTAKQEALAKREALNRALQLFGAQTEWRLPERLPELPAQRPEIADPEGIAAREGFDALMARADSDSFERGVALRAEAREAYAAMLTAYDLAQYQRDVVLPLSQVALEETQQHYNAMLEDAYALLDATREHIAAGKDYVEALAAFWQARAAFVRLIGGREPPPMAPGETAQQPVPAA